MNFSNEEKAREIAIYYAEKLTAETALLFLKSEANGLDATKAASIARFYWDMLDLAVKDQEAGNEILGEVNMEHWMGRLLNIISGYLEELGFESIWEKVSDEVN